MKPIVTYKHLQEIAENLKELKQLRDSSCFGIFELIECDERLAKAIEQVVGLAEIIRRDELEETLQ